jgi:hypothetical protein
METEGAFRLAIFVGLRVIRDCVDTTQIAINEGVRQNREERTTPDTETSLFGFSSRDKRAAVKCAYISTTRLQKSVKSSSNRFRALSTGNSNSVS